METLDASKFSDGYHDLPLESIKGFAEYDVFAEMSKVIWIPEAELFPYCIKVSEGFVEAVYPPKVGIDSSGSMAIQIGRLTATIDEKLFEDHFDVNLNESQKGVVVQYYGANSSVEIMALLVSELDKSQYKSVKTFNGLKALLKPLHMGAKILNPIDYQDSKLTATALIVKDASTRDGGTFKSANCEVEIEGVKYIMSLKGRAKESAINMVGDDGRMELPPGSILKIGKGSESSYKGNAFTRLPMYLSIPHDSILKACNF